MSRLADVERLLAERPGSDYVAGASAAERLAREAHRAGKLLSIAPGDPPDVVARVGEVPLRVRCRVLDGVVYVVRAQNVPAPTEDDWRQAQMVAKIVQSL